MRSLLAFALALASLAGAPGCGTTSVSPPVAKDQPRAPEIDIGTFEGRQSGNGYPVAWAWSSVTPLSPLYEVWAIYEGGVDGYAAYVKPAPNMVNRTMSITYLSDAKYGTDDPAVDADRLLFRDAVVQRLSALGLTVPAAMIHLYVMRRTAAPGTATKDKGVFAPGWYCVYDQAVATNLPVAWVWHSSANPGREFWYLRGPQLGGSGQYHLPSDQWSASDVVVGVPVPAGKNTFADFRTWVLDAQNGFDVTSGDLVPRDHQIDD